MLKKLEILLKILNTRYVGTYYGGCANWLLIYKAAYIHSTYYILTSVIHGSLHIIHGSLHIICGCSLLSSMAAHYYYQQLLIIIISSCSLLLSIAHHYPPWLTIIIHGCSLLLLWLLIIIISSCSLGSYLNHVDRYGGRGG